MNSAPHFTAEVLVAGLDHVRQSPRSAGVLDLIVRRPAVDQREVVAEALLDMMNGLVGDSWFQRGGSRTPDKRANPDAQITIMNSRAISLIAGMQERWLLAGDQLFTELDLNITNLPAGSRLKIGAAVIEISEEPHTGCSKFKARFGADALAFVNSPEGRELRLRGANARIVSAGVIRAGDEVIKL